MSYLTICWAGTGPDGRPASGQLMARTETAARTLLERQGYRIAAISQNQLTVASVSYCW